MKLGVKPQQGATVGDGEKSTIYGLQVFLGSKTRWNWGIKTGKLRYGGDQKAAGLEQRLGKSCNYW